jgi:predicted helicase
MEIKDFKKEIEENLEVGTERTLYKPLGNFLESFIKDTCEKDVKTFAEQSSLNYSKRVGFPDIAIKDQNFTIGYIELKLPSDSLDNKNHKKQFDKYRDSLENIIFTNLKTWQLYQWDGESKSKKVKEVIFDYQNPDEKELKKILELFLSYVVKNATSSHELATNLAKRTKILSEIIESLIKNENREILKLKENFQISLLHDIKEKSFANLIAETFTYSLFIASIQHFEKKNNENLTVTTALDYIPRTIPILYELYDLSKNLSRNFSNVKDSVELILKELNLSDLGKIIASFKVEEKKQDPILNFYEPFLKSYDPETKKERGAFYTPKPVVDFIVRETDKILTNELDLDSGFLENGVKVLDPATGTGTFLSSLIDLVKKRVDENYSHLGMEKEKFRESLNHILNDFYGFEFMVAPYTVAHLKLILKLRAMEFELKDDERFQIYLANTLDDPNKEPNSLLGFNIAEEGKRAKEIKSDENIIAIIGNPPYSGTSQNPSKIGNKEEESYEFKRDKKVVKNLTWIGSQIENYKWNGEKKLDEKNPKWLQDDYVKFIRFAQYQIDSKEKGIVSYIVPHGFLDNPTFRYMRKSLLDSFSKIYLIDLHGNSTKKEKTPEGGKDENVFDIKQGVTLMFLVKKEKSEGCKVFHGDLWGLRKEKFQKLEKETLETLCKTEVFPKDDMFYFIPRNTELEDEYLKFKSVKDIFEINSVGIVTGGDKRFIKDKIEDFEKEFSDTEKFKEVSYRPFDNKNIYYDTKLIERAREKIMKHMLKENIALLVGRAGNVTGSENWDIVFIANSIVDLNMFRRGGEVVFPLYKYSEDNGLFETKSPNFTKEFSEFLKTDFPNQSPETIFYYIYGTLFSPNYRKKYREFLQTDFPRVDFSNKDISKISEIGKELAELHLLKHKIFKTPKEWKIQKIGTDLNLDLPKKAKVFDDGKIYFNSSTFIDGISDEVWNFHIGGYQVLYKWLSDKNRTELSIEDLTHYMKIIISIQKTTDFMKKVDNRDE